MNEINYFSVTSSNFFFLKKYIYFVLLKHWQNLKTRNFKRTQDFVNFAYDQGTWDRVLQSKFWEKYDSLESFLYGTFQSWEGRNKQTIALYENKLCALPVSILQEKYIKQRIDVFRKFLPLNGEIVEIGCGIGYNLFSLRLHKFENNLTGFDISKNSINSANIINDKFSLGVKFENIGLTKNFESSKLKGKTIFTNYVFEQLTHLTNDALMKILESEPLQVFHFEPLYELYENTLHDAARKKYIEFKDYQKTLFIELKNMERKNLIEITHCYKLNTAPNPLHVPYFIRWIPKSPKN